MGAGFIAVWGLAALQDAIDGGAEPYSISARFRYETSESGRMKGVGRR